MSDFVLRIEIAAAPALMAILEALARSLQLSALTASPVPFVVPAQAEPPGGMVALDVSSYQTAPAATPSPPATSCDPPPETAAMDRTGRRWTAARAALLERDYTADVPLGDIVQRLNALPGPLVEKTHAQSYAQTELHLRRERVPARAASLPEPKWTQERRDLYRRLYANGATNAEIRSAVNALPGPIIDSVDGVSGWLKVSRRQLGRLHPASPPPGSSASNLQLGVAARQLADDAANAAFAYIDWRGCLDWAERAKVDMTGDDDALLDRVNGSRRVYGLPEFRIIASRGPASPLAPVSAIAHG